MILGVKYLIKEHTLHLKEALENKYTVTKDWEGKLLYNARSMEPKFLMTLNSLAAGADKSDN